MKHFTPVILSSLFCCVLLYSGVIKPLGKNSFSSLIPNSEIRFLHGTVTSNPVKSSSGKTYSVAFSPLEVAAGKKDLSSIYKKSSSYGELTLYIPSEIVEAYYPGKLYSLSTKKNVQNSANNFTNSLLQVYGGESQFPIIENGLSLTISGSYLERENGEAAFYLEKIFSHGYKSKIQYYRAYSRLFLKRILYNWGECGGLLLALLSGSKEYTSLEIQENFSKAGLAHVLALSGMHLSIFASLPGRFFKKKSEMFSLIVVFLFVWFAGLSPSLLRALISMIISLVCKKLSIKTNLLGILSLSFLIQISIFPSHIFNYGFILSYAALVGLELGQKMFLPWLCKVFPKKISSDLSASLGAQTVTSPITLLGFGTCSPIGIIASVIVSPIATIFLSFGVFAVILSMVLPFLLKPIGCIMSLIYAILTWIVDFFSKFPIIQISN